MARKNRLTPLEEMGVYFSWCEGKKQQKEIADDYNVSLSTIARILRRKRKEEESKK